jgi:hypothetical protein
MRRLISFFIIVVIVTVSFVSAQTRKPNMPSSEVRLSMDKPSVYISYERSGKREPLHVGESDEGIWLRLHNNTKWKIKFPVSGAPETHGDVGMFYTLEVVSELPDEVVDIPKGDELGHVYSPFEVRSGESVLFSVPREHLPKGIVLRVKFSYEWENQDDVSAGREVEHTVSYYASNLPQLKK